MSVPADNYPQCRWIFTVQTSAVLSWLGDSQRIFSSPPIAAGGASINIRSVADISDPMKRVKSPKLNDRARTIEIAKLVITECRVLNGDNIRGKMYVWSTLTDTLTYTAAYNPCASPSSAATSSDPWNLFFHWMHTQAHMSTKIILQLRTYSIHVVTVRSLNPPPPFSLDIDAIYR